MVKISYLIFRNIKIQCFRLILVNILVKNSAHNLSNLIYKLKIAYKLKNFHTSVSLTNKSGNKLDRALPLKEKKKKRIDSLSRILKKLFSIFILPRIDICSFLYSPQSIPPLRDFIIEQCANNLSSVQLLR